MTSARLLVLLVAMVASLLVLGLRVDVAPLHEDGSCADGCCCSSEPTDARSCCDGDAALVLVVTAPPCGCGGGHAYTIDTTWLRAVPVGRPLVCVAPSTSPSIAAASSGAPRSRKPEPETPPPDRGTRRSLRS